MHAIQHLIKIIKINTLITPLLN